LSGTRDAVFSRLLKLKDRMLSTKPTICLERARFYTDVYWRFEAKPLNVRRALILEQTLENASIFIDECELKIGN